MLAKSNRKVQSKVATFINQCLTLWLRKPCLSIRTSPRALKLFQIITKHTWELGLSFVDHGGGQVTLTIVLGNNLSQIFSFNRASWVLMELEEYESNHLRNKLIRFLIISNSFQATISDIYIIINRKKVKQYLLRYTKLRKSICFISHSAIGFHKIRLKLNLLREEFLCFREQLDYYNW